MTPLQSTMGTSGEFRHIDTHILCICSYTVCARRSTNHHVKTLKKYMVCYDAPLRISLHTPPTDVPTQWLVPSWKVKERENEWKKEKLLSLAMADGFLNWSLFLMRLFLYQQKSALIQWHELQLQKFEWMHSARDNVLIKGNWTTYCFLFLYLF